MTDDDISFLLEWENNPEFWAVSDFPGPYTKEQLITHIRQSDDLQKNGQLRLIIHNEEREPIGTVDIYGYDAPTGTAAIGIMIAHQEDRNKGYAGDALSAVISFFRKNKFIHVFRCLIFYDNIASLALFRKNNFQEVADRNFNGKRAIQFILELRKV